jgi:predicted NodU family carbamoyl transferase
MNIIGINYYHNGSSAVLIKDGVIQSAICEERLNRIKSSSKFPTNSIELILSNYNLTDEDIDFYCINTSSKILSIKKIFFFLTNFNFNSYFKGLLFKK